MDQKIENIKMTKHPYSKEIKGVIDSYAKWGKNFLIAFNCIGIVIALVASIGLSKYFDKVSSWVTVNLFGYSIEFSEDSFFVSPPALFVYIIIVFMVISLIMFLIWGVILLSLELKMYELNSFHRTEKLMELLVEKTCGSQEETSESDENNNGV